MFDSKALKDFSDKKRSKIYSWWVGTTVSKYYYDFTWKFIGRPIYLVKKLYGWYVNVFKNDFDFDGHSLYAIIEYKLKRVEKCLLKGYAIQEPKDMHALRLAIKLAGRLKEDKYEERSYDRIDRKYGEMKTWFEPCNDGTDNSYFRSSRSKVKTEEEKKEEWNYRLLQYNLSDYRMRREERWMYAILHKHLRIWWD
jgi:hypothetical protein